MSTVPPSGRAFPRYDPRAARLRVLLAFVVFTGTALALGSHFSLAVRLVAAWDAAALVLLTLMWLIIWRAGPAESRRRAGAVDPGRKTLWVIVLVASVFSLFAGAVVLPQARSLAPEAASELVVLSLGAVATAWLLTHTAFALRYAHLYYREEDGVGGLEFAGKRAPDDFDFAYFSFTLGMCFQVSDVVVSSHVIRRDVLVHAMISFAYNTAILTTALNFALGAMER